MQYFSVRQERIIMKRISIPLVFLLLPALLLAQEPTKWNNLNSTHFIVYYKKAQRDFIDQVIERLENYYDRIADDLGFRRFEFWLWENRAKIYIYDDNSDYQASTGQPYWSGGFANINEKIIHTYPNATGFFDTILAHEMGHIIFREFVGFNNPAVPFWLDEGVASYQERARLATANQIVREAINRNSFIPLEKLSTMNPHFILDKEVVNLFYAEAVSIVDYLIKQFGKDNFVLFCQRLRDKKNLEEAFRITYSFKNLQELNQAWIRYLQNV